jgi:hypothetical protein
MSDYLARTNNGRSFTGSDVTIFQAAMLASALRLYAETGIKVNRSYTPTNMLATAKSLTGNTYKRGAFLDAANDLTALVERMKSQPRVEDDKSPV